MDMMIWTIYISCSIFIISYKIVTASKFTYKIPTCRQPYKECGQGAILDFPTTEHGTYKFKLRVKKVWGRKLKATIKVDLPQGK